MITCDLCGYRINPERKDVAVMLFTEPKNESEKADLEVLGHVHIRRDICNSCVQDIKLCLDFNEKEKENEQNPPPSS